MIGYMNLEEQANADFSGARWQAFLRWTRARLRRDAAQDRLFCFDEVQHIPGAAGRIYRGRRTVPVGQIGGSVGRCSDFNRSFLPTKASVK
jgi:hypothetical protein